MCLAFIVTLSHNGIFLKADIGLYLSAASSVSMVTVLQEKLQKYPGSVWLINFRAVQNASAGSLRFCRLSPLLQASLIFVCLLTGAFQIGDILQTCKLQVNSLPSRPGLLQRYLGDHCPQGFRAALRKKPVFYMSPLCWSPAPWCGHQCCV